MQLYPKLEKNERKLKSYTVFIKLVKTSPYKHWKVAKSNNFMYSSLVGHSMGGLVIRNYLHTEKYKTNFKNIKSVVTIATPHNQSITAHKINKALKGFLGTAGEAGLR